LDATDATALGEGEERSVGGAAVHAALGSDYVCRGSGSFVGRCRVSRGGCSVRFLSGSLVAGILRFSTLGLSALRLGLGALGAILGDSECEKCK
jgi:hypothetical protein